MFCPKCGKPCAEGMRFCQYCGAPLESTASPESAAAPSYNPAPIPVAENPTLHAIRQMARSPLYLVGAIGYACMILFALSASLSGGTLGGLTQYLSLISRLGGSSYELNYLLGEFYDLMPVLQGVSFATTILTQLPAILVAVGIWMMFASAVDRSGAPLKTAGLTMIRVVEIVVMVCQCVLLVAVEGLIILVMVAVGRYDDSATPLFVVLMLVCAFIMGLSILYYAKLVQTIGMMRSSIRYGQPSARVSVYVAVLTIIGGGASVLSLLQFGSVFSTLSSLSAAVAEIGYGIFLFQYRSRMRILLENAGMNGYSQDGQVENDVRPSQQPVPVRNRPVEPEPYPQATPEACPQARPEPVSSWGATRPVSVGETEILREPQETTVLNQPTLPTVRLVRVKNNSVIVIDRAQFRIGRDPGVADYIITDNTAVGRQHADIVQHDGVCFVVDLNSINGTYVNGQRVQPGEEFPMHDGDQLMLGDECFCVQIS